MAHCLSKQRAGRGDIVGPLEEGHPIGSDVDMIAGAGILFIVSRGRVSQLGSSLSRFARLALTLSCAHSAFFNIT